ncbi:MAG: zinc ribbon domain-containing protein [Chloroflexi bacterium]|nr:zinc ribbon domain-containing protein [Chloroflexota bacterium]
MPIYEYQCTECRTRFQALRRMSQADEPIECPACHGQQTERAVSLFVIFSRSAEGSSVSVSSSGGCASCAGGSCATCRH